MNFVLTYYWYDQIETGNKTHEYRANKMYWAKRINKLHVGDKITFSRGYTKQRINAVITDIRFIPDCVLLRDDLDAFEFMRGKSCNFFDIEFERVD